MNITAMKNKKKQIKAPPLSRLENAALSVSLSLYVCLSLASYIKKFACSNAKTEDLWAALEEGSSEPVNQLMNSWTKQKGYPIVSVKVKDQKLVFEQSQFLASGSLGDGQWIVPITLCRGSYDVHKNFLLQTKSETLDMKELPSDGNNLASSWVKLNVNQTGFYRVKYDEDLAAKLRYAIENKYLSATDRFGILDDSFALCMARQQPLNSLLTLMGAYSGELEYTVLSNLINISYKVERIAADANPELQECIKQFFITLFLRSAMKIGWEPKKGESHLDAMLRGEVWTALAVFGYDPALKEGSRRFHAFLDDRNTPLLHPDIRKAAYVAVMRRVSNSNRFGFENLLRVYRETDLSQEKTRVLSSLASSPDPSIILEALNFLLSSEVCTQDAVLGLAVSREGREIAWTWLKDNWEHISKTWGSRYLINRFVSSIVSPTEDLWAALEEGSGEPVNKLMNSWTKQKGYPVVSVEIKDQTLVFEQSQFLSSGSHGDGQWIVPITLCCGSYDAHKNFLLQTKSETLNIKEFLSDKSNSASAWIKLNVDQAGFYRVKYDEDLAARLRYAIENNYLSATDRFGILDDSFALCMARQQSLTSLLTLMGAYREEVEYTVLSNLISISYKIVRIAADATPDLVDYVKQFFISLFQCSAEKLGWDPKTGESHLDAMLRGEVLNALALFGHDLTLNEASRRFHAFLDDKNTPLLPPDTRKAAYVAVMRRVSNSNKLAFESLLRLYKETDLSQEKTRILSSLASSPDPNIILEVLNFLLSSEVRSQDAVYGLAISREGRETAWTWLKFASFEKAKEIEEYFASRSMPSIARTLKQSIERIHINADWVQSVQNEKHLAEAVKELAHRKY
ncbi:aminopeptidase m1 [Quercus suber]|uniref:Aminopeptidase m1 n=1 Tax=Quercus suber TaxID=58331 RepID=A0AAW0IQQ8_QUESU